MNKGDEEFEEKRDIYFDLKPTQRQKRFPLQSFYCSRKRKLSFSFLNARDVNAIHMRPAHVAETVVKMTSTCSNLGGDRLGR